MGCGCNKSRTVAPPPSAQTMAALQPQQTSPVMYDVFDGEGSLVASYTNPVTARAEARRSGGNMVPRTSSLA